MGVRSVRRFFIVAVAVGAAVLLQAGVTAEAAEVCSEDPAIHFIDAWGHPQTVYLTNYWEGVEHTRAVKAERYLYTVERIDTGHRTKVRLRVIVPDDSPKHFHVRFTVTTSPNGAGIRLAEHHGESGHINDLEFETRS
jgi:hypothetical protein